MSIHKSATLLGLGTAGWATAGLSAISSLVSGSQKRRQERRELRARQTQFGVNAAAAKLSIDRQLSFAPTQAAGINKEEQLANMAINANQAEAEADIRVNAAAAGVSGASVDTAIGDTELSAAKNLMIIDLNTELAKDRLSTDLVDSQIRTEISKGKFLDNGMATSKKTDYGLAGLSFLSTYLAKL